jgi:hypothetical protein
MPKASETAKQIAKDVEQLASALEAVEVEVKKPKASTKATEKYQKEAGMAAKTYKLKAADAEIFKKACEERGESQSSVLTKLMIAYATDNEVKNGCWVCRILSKLRRKKGAD